MVSKSMRLKIRARILFIDKEKAAKFLQSPGNLISDATKDTDGFTHAIADINSNVKIRLSEEIQRIFRGISAGQHSKRTGSGEQDALNIMIWRPPVNSGEITESRLCRLFSGQLQSLLFFVKKFLALHRDD